MGLKDTGPPIPSRPPKGPSGHHSPASSPGMFLLLNFTELNVSPAFTLCTTANVSWLNNPLSHPPLKKEVLWLWLGNTTDNLGGYMDRKVVLLRGWAPLLCHLKPCPGSVLATCLLVVGTLLCQQRSLLISCGPPAILTDLFE